MEKTYTRVPPIFAKSGYGAVYFTLGSCSQKIENDLDVPEAILNCVSSYKATDIGALELCGKDYAYTLILKKTGCFLLDEKTKEVSRLSETPDSICRRLFTNIQDRMQDWTSFMYPDDRTLEKNYEKTLKSRISVINMMDEIRHSC